jgi:hypothetical protein
MYNLLAKEILAGMFLEGETIRVFEKGGKLEFEGK